MTKLLSTTALAAMLALGGAAWAQTAGAPGTQGTQGTQGQAGQTGGAQRLKPHTPGTAPTAAAVMSEEQVRARLAAEGYTNVQSITRDGNKFHARATRHGEPVSVTFNADSGAIESQAARR